MSTASLVSPFLIALASLVLALAGPPGFGLIRSPLSPPAPLIKTPPPRTGILPPSHDWRNVNGTSFVTPVRNQLLPQWCGSCWAIAVTSSLSDRLKILRIRGGDIGADVELSPQHLLSCAGSEIGSCEGGDDHLAYEWIASNGIEDATCSPYRAADDQCHSRPDVTRYGQLEKTTCRICHSSGICEPVENPTRYRVEEHGGFQEDKSGSNETAMMQEIFHRGPITCSIFAEVKDFTCYDGEGVIDYPPVTKDVTHVVSVVGFGEEKNGGKYWIARHSGGVYWGDSGFFRIRRGNNTMHIESFCYWGTIKVEPFSVQFPTMCRDGPCGGNKLTKICTD